MPVRFKVLENVKVPEIWVVWVRFAFSGPCLESLHLAVNKVCWCNLTPACNELEGNMNRSDGK